MTATTQLEEQKTTIQLEDNATAMIEWNEQESRFDIVIHLMAERHNVTYLSHPSRGIETMTQAIEFASEMLILINAQYLRCQLQIIISSNPSQI